MATTPSSDPQQLSPFSLRTPEPGERLKARLTASVSVAAHVVAAGVLLVLPLLSEEHLPEQARGVHAFFAPPLELPPPPPPPAAAIATTRVQAPPPVSQEAFTAPIDVPQEIVPDAGIDLGVEGGVSGGVEGGVPGGVVGGIVGGLPEAPPPPPLQPLRVGGVVKEPRKLKEVKPVYPVLALSGRVEGVVILECVVDTRGRVQEAKVLRGVPVLDQAALDAVRQWVYSTTLVDGKPVPVVMTVTVSFRLG